MCLRFVCRVVINEYEKEDLYCLLKSLHEHAQSYLISKKIHKSISSPIKTIFTPRCLLVDHLPFPCKSVNYGTDTKNTLVAWFGIMDPNEMGGLINTTQIIKDFIETLPDKQGVLGQLPGIKQENGWWDKAGTIRIGYNDTGTDTHSDLTILSVAQLFNL